MTSDERDAFENVVASLRNVLAKHGKDMHPGDFAGRAHILRVAEDILRTHDAPAPECPHGFIDWDNCPDCCH